MYRYAAIICLLVIISLPQVSLAQSSDIDDMPESLRRLLGKGMAINTWGQVDDVQEDEIVVGDTEVKLASNLTIKTSLPYVRTADDLMPGMMVGYLLNKNGEIQMLFVAPEP